MGKWVSNMAAPNERNRHESPSMPRVSLDEVEAELRALGKLTDRLISCSLEYEGLKRKDDMVLVLELPDGKEAALKAKAQAQGVSEEQYAQEVLEHALEASPSPVAAASRRHISEAIRERMRKIPAEVWAELPADGASEHDHYIYGLPKRNP
jgi:plasmid stability protein